MANGQTNISGGKTLIGTAQPSDVRMGMTYADGKELRDGTLNLTNLLPENIREGVSIGGVVGECESLRGGYFYEHWYEQIPELKFEPTMSHEDRQYVKETVSFYDSFIDKLYTVSNDGQIFREVARKYFPGQKMELFCYEINIINRTFEVLWKREFSVSLMFPITSYTEKRVSGFFGRKWDGELKLWRIYFIGIDQDLNLSEILLSREITYDTYQNYGLEVHGITGDFLIMSVNSYSDKKQKIIALNKNDLSEAWSSERQFESRPLIYYPNGLINPGAPEKIYRVTDSSIEVLSAFTGELLFADNFKLEIRDAIKTFLQGEESNYYKIFVNNDVISIGLRYKHYDYAHGLYIVETAVIFIRFTTQIDAESISRGSYKDRTTSYGTHEYNGTEYKICAPDVSKLSNLGNAKTSPIFYGMVIYDYQNHNNDFNYIQGSISYHDWSGHSISGDAFSSNEIKEVRQLSNNLYYIEQRRWSGYLIGPLTYTGIFEKNGNTTTLKTKRTSGHYYPHRNEGVIIKNNLLITRKPGENRVETKFVVSSFLPTYRVLV